MIYVGIDWSESHHDVCVLDERGEVLAKGRVPEGVEGLSRLHAMVADHAEDPAEVVVAIELDRGLLVGALVAAGYRVHAVNPYSVSRYRDRVGTSGAKSDPGDARVLADLVRTDRHLHREVAGDSGLAEAVKVLARAHQRLVWTRTQHVNELRSALREYYPGALQAFSTEQLATHEACSVLVVAPTPERGRALTFAKIRRMIAASGRSRNLDRRAMEIYEALHAPQLEQPPTIAEAYGDVAGSLVVLIDSLVGQIARLEAELRSRFEVHPDAEILLSLPGLGSVLGARVLGEFGDDPTRYADGRARRNYAGTSPITKASGNRRVVLARFARNRRLADACYLWAFSSLKGSPGARRYYDALRGRGRTHHQALRAVANRLVGILHACLASRSAYEEGVAWPTPVDAAA